MDAELSRLLHDLSNALIGLANLPQAALALDICQEMQNRLPKDDSTIRPLVLSERFAAFEEQRRDVESAFNVRLQLTHDVSADCVVWASLAVSRQVTRNLVANAANAGAKLVRFHYLELPTAVRIVIADDGNGMAPCRVCPKRNPQDDHRGGVQIVRDLVYTVGGQVTWDSREGIGTWVTIMLRKVVTLPSVAP